MTTKSALRLLRKEVRTELDKLIPRLVFPSFDQLYDTPEQQREWFKKHNSFYDYDEWIKDQVTFFDCYQNDLTTEEIIKQELDFAPVKPERQKERDEIIRKYNNHPIEWMVRTETYIDKV